MSTPVTHTLVATLRELPGITAEGDFDYCDFDWSLECSNPDACDGWTVCHKDHDDLPPASQDAADEGTTHLSHGVEHTAEYLDGGYIWAYPTPGCAYAPFWHGDIPDSVRPAAGRYAVEPDFGDSGVDLIYLGPAED